MGPRFSRGHPPLHGSMGCYPWTEEFDQEGLVEHWVREWFEQQHEANMRQNGNNIKFTIDNLLT